MDTPIWTPTTLTGGNNIPGSESFRERMKNKREKKSRIDIERNQQLKDK